MLRRRLPSLPPIGPKSGTVFIRFSPQTYEGNVSVLGTLPVLALSRPNCIHLFDPMTFRVSRSERSVQIYLLGVLVFCTTALQITAEIVSTELVNRLAASLKDQHPALRALKFNEEATRLNAESVRSWADPTARIGGNFFGTRGSLPSQNGDIFFGVSQALPLMGKEVSARKFADELARTAKIKSEARWVELRRDLAAGLITLALAERTLFLNESDAAWLQRAESVALAQQSSRPGSLPALLRLQNDLAQAESTVANDRLRRTDARVALDRRLGLDNPLKTASLELPAVVESLPFSQTWINLALGAEPRLRLARRNVEEAGSRVDLTRRSARPNLTIDLESRQFSGDGRLREGLVSLGFSLPWFNQANYRRDLARDKAHSETAKMELRDAEAGVGAEIHHLLSLINTAGRDARLLRDIVLPRSRTAVSTSEALLTSSSIEVRDVLDLHRQLIENELRLANSIASQWTALSELLLCCGLDDLATLLTPAPTASTPSLKP